MSRSKYGPQASALRMSWQHQPVHRPTSCPTFNMSHLCALGNYLSSLSSVISQGFGLSKP